MRAVLQAISEELVRLKADGEQHVPVTEEALAGLRKLVAAKAGGGEIAASGAGSANQESRAAGGEPRSAAGAVSGAGRVAGERSAPGAAAPVVKLAPAPVVKAAWPPAPTVLLPEGDKPLRWAALEALVRADAAGRERLPAGRACVVGAGSLEAKVFFVGDELGSEAGAGGDPFQGPAGEVLAKMIRAMGLAAEDIFVGNLVPWRPPAAAGASGAAADKRVVGADELAYALAYVRAAVELIRPTMVVGLGLTAAQALLARKVANMPEVKGRWEEFAGVPLILTYHPAYVMQNGTNRSKRAVWEDLMKVMEKAGRPISEKQRAYFL